MCKSGKRIVALLLAFAMLLSTAACGKQPAVKETESTQPGQEVQMQAPAEETVAPEETSAPAQTEKAPEASEEAVPETTAPKSPQGSSQAKPGGSQGTQTGNKGSGTPTPPKVEEDRESMEQIVDLLDKVTPGGTGLTDDQISNMDDESLSKLVSDLLEKTDNQPSVTPGTQTPEEFPELDLEEGKEGYDENGAMELPFDQLYPDVVAQEQVEFDKETLLIKMANSYGGAITQGMKDAGVAAMEPIVPMETATWYEAKLVKGTNVASAVDALRALSEIMLVDYNYQVETAAMAEFEALPEGWADNTQVTEQWYLNYCGIPSGVGELSVPGGSSSVIVAVIDTGVDYTHEDLADNIWVNTAETPDNGIDDDGNGYIDDYYGVDIVAGTGSGNDDNGHGTHVAGIIAAKNNNLGVVGIAHNVKIMPVKAAMASGYLNQSDIAKAILYAYEHGAEVINMSFGGAACSIAVQDALAVAYTRCVLVASAGNEGMPNESRVPSLPNYPAALSYVLGVMSVNQAGRESAFTNWDVELYSPYEYELYAPGEGILSTIPGNRYASWSGTSMAAPVVAAMAALLRSEYSDRDTYPTKFIYGQLVATSEDSAACLNPDKHGLHNLPPIVNLYKALTVMPKPDVGLQDYALFDTEGMEQDTAGVNSGEGVIDAGETIALGLTLRNRWGMSKDTIVKIDTLSSAGIADPYITIHNPEVNYGSVGTYSTGNCGAIYTDGLLTGWENPFYITIAENCPNDYIFRLNVTVTCGNALDEGDTAQYVNDDGAIELMVRNGTVLPAIIEEDMVLTSDNLYIIPNSTVIQEGVTVRVEPGTHIQFWSNDEDDPYASDYIAYLVVKGNFLVEGTRDNPVYIYPSDLMSRYPVQFGEEDKGCIILKYADITNFCYSESTYGENEISVADHCTFRMNYSDGIRYRYMYSGVIEERSNGNPPIGTIYEAESCMFYRIGGNGRVDLNGSLNRCAFVDCGIDYGSSRGVVSLNDCLILGGSHYSSETLEIVAASTVRPQKNDYPVDWVNPGIAYRPETGTTYFVVDDDTEINLELLKQYGIEPAVMETEDEWEWVKDNWHVMLGFMTGSANYYMRLGLAWTPGAGYTWHTGEPVGDFLDQYGVLPTTKRTDKVLISVSAWGSGAGSTVTSVGHIRINTYSSGSYYMFELPGEILPTQITFPEYSVLLDMERNYQLHPQTLPVQVSSDMLIFESSNTDIVKVDENGLVTPVGIGTADVYVYSRDRAVWNYVTFEVRDYVALEDISFEVDTVELALGETYTAEPILYPADTTRRNVTYTSSDSSIAIVNEFGVITAVGSGWAEITASCEEEFELINVLAYKPITSLEVKKVAMAAAIDGEVPPLPEVIVSEGDTSLYWYSYDENVAKVETDGTITLVGEGMTTLKVVDSYTGLSDTVDLYVSQTELPRTKEVLFRGESFSFVLMEDGNLYRVGYGTSPTALVAENVLDAFVPESYSQLYILFEDGRIGYYDDGSGLRILRDLAEYEPVALGVAMNGGSDTVDGILTKNGEVYIWRDNTAEPTLVDVGTPVVKLVSDGGGLGLLTENGDFYYYIKSTDTPVLYGRNVIYVNDEMIILTDGVLYECYSSGKTYLGTFQNDYEMVSFTNRYGIGYKNGTYFYLYTNVSEGDPVHVYPEDYVDYIHLENPVFMHYEYNSNDKMLFLMDQDGLLFKVRINQETQSVVPIYSLGTDSLRVSGTNLTEAGESTLILREDVLTLTFNKNLVSASVALYEEGMTAIHTSSFTDNVLTVVPGAGFVEGKTYTLNIAMTAITGANSTTMIQDYSVSFSYVAPEDGESGEDGGTGTEAVIHESQTDDTIDRGIPTVEGIIQGLTELQEREQINSYFRGNVMLNRISTDTNVTNWFRILADETEGEKTPLGGNYWGTTNETAIGLQIVDYSDFVTYGELVYKPYLTEAPENTFPFITDVTILNQYGEKVTEVSNEEITVRVTFNRDMDTSIPLRVRFGSAYPYGDYEIDGTYINARTWEGVYTLTTLIENGNQCFSIADGCSATEDLDFIIDWGRFGFVIDTTAAQALIMQGSATDTGIALTWTQDDFDTLMGYNVYRSTSEDGYYQRLNETVIPAETMEFFDDTVEPGVVYYYNFTVVQTDLSESIPSGKISIMSKDTMAPDLYHSPVYNAFTGANLVISATVTDNLSVTNALVYYRTVGQTQWKTAVMNKLNDKYSAIIPADQITTEGLEYYIEASDGINVTRKGSAEDPYVITVQQAVDASSRGDVNGDGKITNLDALMLLQAINDLLNLNAEQFARADLNGDGVLTAAEALRILHYVSGKVGDLNMP